MGSSGGTSHGQIAARLCWGLHPGPAAVQSGRPGQGEETIRQSARREWPGVELGQDGAGRLCAGVYPLEQPARSLGASLHGRQGRRPSCHQDDEVRERAVRCVGGGIATESSAFLFGIDLSLTAARWK